MKRYKVGTNQYKKRYKELSWGQTLGLTFFATIISFGVIDSILPSPTEAQAIILSPVAPATSRQVVGELKVTPTPVEIKPSELEEIVAYIARVFEPEGKDVVVRAINCFYSESGLRKDAVGQNSDKHKSKDFGVAQLNDYWHNLTSEEKTEIKANIDRAYKIYKSRGDSFEAWYGKLCQ